MASLLNPSSAAGRLLNDAAANSRMIVFCGIPGVGKSLMVRETVALAADHGRRLSLLQWDVARLAFETPEILQRYPEVGGSTHVMIRRAVGLWARRAIAQWQRHAERNQLLLVEAPLVGGRMSELAERIDDDAEELLRKEARFLVPTPTIAVRTAIKEARRREMASHRHARDAANAIPELVDELWELVARTAELLNLAPDVRSTAYSPAAYYAVYAAVLKHRQVTALPVEEVLPVTDSPHALSEQANELRPTPGEVPALMLEAEAEGLRAVERRAERWYLPE